MKVKNYFPITFLKALSITGIVVIHFLSYHLSNPTLSTLWNWLHFVVPAFVFASGYLVIPKAQKRIKDLKFAFLWLKKRLVRLLLPFYLYLATHYLLTLLFPSYFKAPWLKKSGEFILQSILLIGGVDFNWFVLLFVQLALITVFLAFIWKKKPLIWVFILISFFSSLAFYSLRPQYNTFRWTMILPWSFVYILGGMVFEVEKKIKRKNLFYFLNFLTFLFIFFSFRPNLSRLVLTQHKYPPNLLYLSYGISATFFLLLLSKLKIWDLSMIKRLLNFTSKNSYTIFFTHYIAIDFIFNLLDKANFLNAIGMQLTTILIISFLLAWLVNKLLEKI